MERMTSGFSRPLLKWSSQVAASLAATLAATLIWSAVPHPGAAPARPPEMTSGGKFAARAIQPVAYDGLDAMPLPHVAPVPAVPATPAFDLGPATMTHRAALNDVMPLAPAAEHAPGAVRPARPAARAEARRAEPAQRAAALPVAVASEGLSEVREDDGILHRIVPSALPHVLPGIVATARDAWTVTASAGTTLAAAMIPGIR